VGEVLAVIGGSTRLDHDREHDTGERVNKLYAVNHDQALQSPPRALTV
jgi:hypothetical protein